MFTVTREWLKENYGSLPHQVEETRKWLLQYGTNVPSDQLNEWAQWKHLSEYQVNTINIVPQALELIGKELPSELSAHRLINILRVPVASVAYATALCVAKPVSILELGVGGDSAISTAIFLSYLEYSSAPQLISIDRNPLGKTHERYYKYPWWVFIQEDSVKYLNGCLLNNKKFDMVFIDTIHSYEHTYNELNIACQLTNYMLMDDATFEGNNFDLIPGGVKEAIKIFMKNNPNWKRLDYGGASVCLLIKD